MIFGVKKFVHGSPPLFLTTAFVKNFRGSAVVKGNELSPGWFHAVRPGDSSLPLTTALVQNFRGSAVVKGNELTPICFMQFVQGSVRCL